MRLNHTPAKQHSRRNRIAFLMCAALVVACLFVIANARGGGMFASLIQAGDDNSINNQANTGAYGQGKDDQDYATYRHLFSHIVHLQKKGEAADAKREDGGTFRHLYKYAAGLDDEQEQSLTLIATECEAEVAKIDAKAWKIVEAFRRRVQNLPPTERPPSPPDELKVLQEEKNRTVLMARDRLRSALGAGEFERLHKFLKEDVGLKIERRPVVGPRP
jgi:hypothetical protein